MRITSPISYLQWPFPCSAWSHKYSEPLTFREMDLKFVLSSQLAALWINPFSAANLNLCLKLWPAESWANKPDLVTLAPLGWKVFQPEYLPCVAHVSGVLCWLFPREPAERLFPLLGPLLLYITRPLWCPEVQEETYQAVYANRRAEIQSRKAVS